MSKRNDIREKVKEIKLRQQNWMKQRAELKDDSVGESTTKAVDPDRNDCKYSHCSKDRSPVSQSVTRNRKEESPAQTLIASKKSKAKFHSWLKAKKAHENGDYEEDIPARQENVNGNAKQYRSDKYSDNVYTDSAYRDHSGSSNVNILRVPSSTSPKYASPDPSWNSDDETGELTQASLLSPDDFGSRADDIIAKVKGDIAISRDDFHENSFRAMRHQKYTSQRARNVPNESSTKSELSSHVCSSCDKLMIPPNADPMLLIPCGHTLCNSCSKRTKYCAICGFTVQSCTPNIMLQQIITNYQSKQRQTQRKSGSTKSSGNNTYVEEYQNLETRQEILREEFSSLSKSVEKMAYKLDKDRQQLFNIERKERSIEDEIETLQEQLKELAEHKSQYEKNVYDSEMKVKQEKNRLILVQDSLKSVEQQMEKVKLLAEEGW